MWNHKYLACIDFRTIPILLLLMSISILVITATTGGNGEHDAFLTPMAHAQLRFFGIGTLFYLFFAGFDYHKLHDWTWILYGVMLALLVGLFFTSAVQNVHRWYKIPGINLAFQPSEYAKLIVVLALSWFVVQKGRAVSSANSAFEALIIVFIPFVLILKQPDLGTALVLFPVTLVIFYLGGFNRTVVRWMVAVGIVGLLFVSAIFLEIIPHEEARPYVTKVIKEYQFERLNPKTYHQSASQAAISLGGFFGKGWKKSSFSGKGWLPASSTDSVFAAFAEEFGLFGVFVILSLFFALIYFSFQITALAKDEFGRLLSAGITVYLAMHIVVNIGMMCGFLPITGVPLTLITYGGSSILSTMIALGILQSIYSRRFMF